MTLSQEVLTIVIVAAGTVFTRLLSFAVFPSGRKTPTFVRYLGTVLPPAVLGMLVIYCYKNINLTSTSHGLPELFAGLVVVILQKWRKNMFLSIIVGTILYMTLIRL